VSGSQVAAAILADALEWESRDVAEAVAGIQRGLDDFEAGHWPFRELGALLAPATDVRELTEDDRLDHVRKARRRIWDERYREATVTALSGTP
jgi:hypothetical protein